MNQRSAIGLTAAALMACASGASAEMVTQTVSFGPAATTWSTSLGFAGFNPALGTLTEVSVTLTEAVAGTVGVTNTGSSSATFQLSLMNRATATFPAPISLPLVTDNSDTYTTPLLSVGGSASHSVSGTGSSTASATTGLSDFEVAFLVPTSDSGGVVVSGGTDGNATFTDTGMVTARVVFDYTPAGAGSPPVPEPASLALFATGMFGVGFARRLKRRREKSDQSG